MDNYTKIENDVLEKLSQINLSGSALACALVLLRKTNGFNKEEDGISLSQFVTLIGRSKPTICKALKELQLVKICLLVKKGKSGKEYNVYRFNKNVDDWQLVKKPKLVKKKKSTSKEIETQLVKKSLHTKETNTKENIQKKYICSFEDWWKLYPRKVAKKKAESIYLKKATDKEIEQSMFDGLRKYIAKWEAEGQEKEYIPHASTWLNGERWEDDIQIEKGSGKKRFSSESSSQYENLF